MINKIYVPNEYNEGAKILAIGESPGDTEESDKKPFVGESGTRLTSTFARYGLSRCDVSFANLSSYRPQGNKFELLKDTPELEQGINEIINHIEENDYNVIACLGKQALQVLTGKPSIMAYRGSILSYTKGNGDIVKVIPTLHPSAVVRDKSLIPIFDGDISRIVSDSKFPELNLPKRNFIIDPRGTELRECVDLLANSPKFSIDIESVKNSTHILCVGFSASSDSAICIVYREDAECQNAINDLLNCDAKKVFHFGTFDTEMLHLNGHETKREGDKAYYWDTLTAAHIINAELPRGLDFLTSTYTREPYYKQSGRAEIPGDTKSWGSKVDKNKLWVYNCKDCCVTLEIQEKQSLELNEKFVDDWRIFEHEMEMIPVGQMMSRNGMLADIERRELFHKALLYRWMTLQAIMEKLAEKLVGWTDPVNVKSPKLKELLYDKFKLPVRKQHNGQITTDEDAIVSLIGYALDYVNGLKRESAIQEWKVKLLVLKCILEVRGIRTVLSNYIKSALSTDNRFRSIYKFSSTDTGRSACEGYVDGTGVNAQTFSRGYVDIPAEINAELEVMMKKLEDELIPEGEFEIIDDPAEQGGTSLSTSSAYLLLKGEE